MKSLRTRIYVDGYNLYYGCLRKTPYKWLDPLKLFESEVLPSIFYEHDGERISTELLPLAIKFFTAQIVPAAAKAQDSISSQAKYHTALRKYHPNRIELIEGYYSVQQVSVKAVSIDAPDTEPRFCEDVLIWKLEEKRSDVNLALHAYHDAISGAVDQVVIVTNDTDIATCLEMIRKHTNVVVGLVTPTKDRERQPNADLTAQAHWVRTHLTATELASSQLPRVISVGRKPATNQTAGTGPHQSYLQKFFKLPLKFEAAEAKRFNG